MKFYKNSIDEKFHANVEFNSIQNRFIKDPYNLGWSTESLISKVFIYDCIGKARSWPYFWPKTVQKISLKGPLPSFQSAQTLFKDIFGTAIGHKWDKFQNTKFQNKKLRSLQFLTLIRPYLKSWKFKFMFNIIFKSRQRFESQGCEFKSRPNLNFFPGKLPKSLNWCWILRNQSKSSIIRLKVIRFMPSFFEQSVMTTEVIFLRRLTNDNCANKIKYFFDPVFGEKYSRNLFTHIILIITFQSWNNSVSTINSTELQRISSFELKPETNNYCIHIMKLKTLFVLVLLGLATFVSVVQGDCCSACERKCNCCCAASCGGSGRAPG
jgi:hypothetical protein